LSLWDATPTHMITQLAEMPARQRMLTREFRLYGLRELARRAGVTAEFFRSWKVTFRDHETVVCVDAGRPKYIRFPHHDIDIEQRVREQKVCVRRASWMQPPDDSSKCDVPSFVVPWVSDEDRENMPLFKSSGPDTVECAFDLPLSVGLTLSRVEETLSRQRDRHSRFPSAASIARQEQCLQRPIVDEYGLAFEQALTHLLPVWEPGNRDLHVLLSQDIDHIGVPFSLEQTVGHLVRRHNLAAAARDFLAAPLGIGLPAYLGCIQQLAEMAMARNLECDVYWKSCPPGPFDSGYDPFHPAARKIISWLQERGIRNGVHPGYETFMNQDRLRLEVDQLTKLLGTGALGGRQHYLRWAHETWIHWEQCGLVYDSTMGYSDEGGFRAGTCIPYRPWLFSENREANLLEIPLVLMDQVLFPQTEKHSLGFVSQLLNRCRSVGGMFTLLWHNSNFVTPRHRKLYTAILDTVAALEPNKFRPEEAANGLVRSWSFGA
jgi:hypothetical protein